MKQMTVFFLALLALLMMGGAAAQESPARVTILYDAFGKPSTLKRGWGYSALVEYGGKRVLFDTGGDNNDFAFNVKTLGVRIPDPRRPPKLLHLWPPKLLHPDRV